MPVAMESQAYSLRRHGSGEALSIVMPQNHAESLGEAKLFSEFARRQCLNGKC